MVRNITMEKFILWHNKLLQFILRDLAFFVLDKLFLWCYLAIEDASVKDLECYVDNDQKS